MWRISHGELPKVKMPKVVMLLIGTDDLGFAYLQSGEAAIADEVQPLVMRCDAREKCSSAAGVQVSSCSALQLLISCSAGAVLVQFPDDSTCGSTA